MPRPKGLPKTGGRKAGTPNHVTSSFRLWLRELIDKNRAQITKDLKVLDPKERLDVLEKFMRYIAPRPQAVTASVDINGLTDEQIDEIIADITSNIEDGNTVE